jgi:hypothetical protein
VPGAGTPIEYHPPNGANKKAQVITTRAIISSVDGCVFAQSKRSFKLLVIDIS